jgi:hypothetical protein
MQRPVRTWPPLVPNALRRTSTIDTHPAGTGNSDVDLRARDVDTGSVLGEVCVRAHLTDRVIDDIDGGLEQLLDNRVGPGFRSAVGRLFPEEVRRASLLHLLLDDWVGAALVSGYAVQHAAINLGIEEKLGPGVAGQAQRNRSVGARGMTLAELRGRIRGEFVGTSTCTHLNDMLRAIADLDALLELGPCD